MISHKAGDVFAIKVILIHKDGSFDTKEVAWKVLDIDAYGITKMRMLGVPYGVHDPAAPAAVHRFQPIFFKGEAFPMYIQSWVFDVFGLTDEDEESGEVVDAIYELRRL